MATSRNDKLMFWGGVALAVVGLGAWGVYQYELALKYCYKIKSFNINDASLSNINATLSVAIRNFANIGISILSVDLDVYVNNIKLTNINSKESQKLDGNGVSIISFGIHVTPKEIAGLGIGQISTLIAALLGDKSKINVRIIGTVGVGLGVLTLKQLPLDMTMTVADMMADDPNAFVCDI